ncbi:MAG: hypothetical protein J6A60_00560 [Clostridia bacterium]|nr:hypothetical protein [Clostridia bacterium]
MGWIAPNKKEYIIGDELVITAGDAGSILKPYKYNIYLEASDTDYILAVKNVHYSDLNGKGIVLDGKTFAALASPYKPGRFLTVRAEGSYSVLGNVKKTTLTTSVYLLCEELLPKVELKARGRDEKNIFGEHTVAGYSYIELTASTGSLLYGGEVTAADFHGSEVYTVDTENMLKAKSAVIKSPGTRTAACRVTVTYTGKKPDGGLFETSWSKTVAVNITVKTYVPPYIDTNYSGNVKPVRTDENGNVIAGNEMNPKTGYYFKFALRIKTDNNLGIKIKSVDSVVIYNTTDEGKLTDDFVTVTAYGTDPTDYAFTIKQQGRSALPVFKENSGCYTYRKYPIVITVTDAVGTHTIETALQAVFVTAHIKAGGRGIRIGGYATEDYVVAIDSEWKFKAEGDMECQGDFTAKAVALDSLSFGGTKYTGVGTGSKQISAGDHAHGTITNDGKLTGGTPKYPVFLDDKNYFVTGDAFPAAMYYSAKPAVDSGEGSGGSSNKIAKGDHVHPTDTSRASQEEFKQLRDDFNAFKDKYNGFL